VGNKNSGNSLIGRGHALAQGLGSSDNAPSGWAWAKGKAVHPPIEMTEEIDFDFSALAQTSPGSALRLFSLQYSQFIEQNATHIFRPHPGQQAVLDYLPSHKVIWLRPGQGFGKSAFNSWIVAKAIKREPILLSSGETWLPPKGRILVATKSRKSQADNIDGFLKRFIPDNLVLNPRLTSPTSIYKTKDGAIDGAEFSTGMELITRTYDSGVMAFMNLTLSLCILDELPVDPEIITELFTRVIGRSGGTILISASDIYSQTAFAAARLKDAARKDLCKIIEGDASENPHLSKSGQETLLQLYTDKEKTIRFHGMGDNSPLLLFPNYNDLTMRLDPGATPYDLSLNTAQWISGLDQGSPASPWGYSLIAYWDAQALKDTDAPQTNGRPVCLVVASLHDVGTNTEIHAAITALNQPFMAYRLFPQGHSLIMIGDPALKIVSPDGNTSFNYFSDHFYLSTPHKPDLMSSYSFINNEFAQGRILLSSAAQSLNDNLLDLMKKRISSKNVPVGETIKDPLDALRYPLHYLHASLSSSSFTPHRSKSAIAARKSSSLSSSSSSPSLPPKFYPHRHPR
jgi:hypothetical protein